MYARIQHSSKWLVNSLPKDIQIRIVSGSGNIERGRQPVLFRETSEKNREEARLRAALISLYNSMELNAEEFLSAYNTGEISRPIFEKLGAISLATFYRWLKGWKERGVDGILPKWGSSPKGSSTLTDLEKSYLEHWYLTQEQRTASHCFHLLREALPQSRAGYTACLRYLQSLPKPLVDFYRLGKRKFEALYQPYIDRDPSLYQPMEQVVSDHHNFDFLVIRDGKIFRPWVTAFQDYCSGKILGWCPSVYPSSLSILIALYLTVVRYGLVDLLHIDNGKDYRSKFLLGETRKVRVINKLGIEEEELISIQGSCAILGMEVVFCRPYHGQSKGRTERTFGTFCEYFSKNTGSYIGSNTVTRPEDAALFYRALNKQAKRNDVYRWEDFVLGLEAFINWWNANWRGNGKGMNGRTPDEVFASGERPKKQVDPETLALALTKPFVRKVRKN
jgi:transposase InsO family protein